MDDGYDSLLLARPLSPGHDIGPDEDRNYAPAQRHTDYEGEDLRRMLTQNGIFIECLDETPSNLLDITDMPNESFNNLDKSLYHEVNRLKTFEGNWNADYFVQAVDLARNGFIYFGPRDKVKCVFCLKTLWNWEQGDSVEFEHQKHYPRCPFVRGNCNHLNVPIDSLETSLGFHMKAQKEEPPQSQLANFSDRLKSFRNWPKHEVLRPEALAEAGFYYLEGDQVKCFSCEKVLSDWKLGDDPWCEHAKYSPGCRHVYSVKGSDFIDIVCSSQPSHNNSSRLGHSVAGEVMNTLGNEGPVTVSEREDPLEHRTHEAEPVPLCVDLAAQLEKDMSSPAVVAMKTFDIPGEKLMEKLKQIRLINGPDYTVTSRDLKDLIN